VSGTPVKQAPIMLTRESMGSSGSHHAYITRESMGSSGSHFAYITRESMGSSGSNYSRLTLPGSQWGVQAPITRESMLNSGNFLITRQIQNCSRVFLVPKELVYKKNRG